MKSYICHNCNVCFKLKNNIAKHIIIIVYHSCSITNIKCSFDNCKQIFKLFKLFTHNVCY